MGGIAIRSNRRHAALVMSLLLAFALVLMVPPESCFATSSKVGPRLHLENTPRVNVYIYNDPVFDETAVIKCYRKYNRGVAPWQDERGGKAQDAGEIWLHQSLLSHPWRVLDPEDADVFFIPIYPVLNAKVDERLVERGVPAECDGLSSQQRATRSIMHLVKNSPYFNRFGGADHVVVCAWWNCGRGALDRQHRMLLRRAVVGINEKLDHWSLWGCGERMVTVPYTPSSAVTTTSVVGGRSPEERDIPFFFEGSSRQRPERENLKAVMHLSPDSLVALGNHKTPWPDEPSDYADNISRSRFCFCPRGDTISSRRIFDAVAAGCIPVITTEEEEALPFLRTGLNYSDFSVVAPAGSLNTVKGVKALVKDLSSRSDQDLATLREGLVQGRSSTVYGATKGDALADMEPFHGTASRFLQDVQIVLDNGGLWNCPSSHQFEGNLSPRTLTEFPPEQNERSLWLHESETIVNEEQSLLFCAPPNTGSLQFRMLAKRMKGLDHWSSSDIQSLVFDPVGSKLPLLDLTDKRLMEAIYSDNGSGWIKIGVVRDPVTRFLSAYLDLVRTWPSGSTGSSSLDRAPQHRGLRTDDGWEWFDAITSHRYSVGDEAEQQQPQAGEHQTPPTWSEDSEGRGGGDGSRWLEDSAVPPVPTFEELLDMLEGQLMTAPSTFRPAASLCGMGLSPFDTIIPFETLKQTSTKVLKSLPGDIWRDFGASGWGPDRKHAFMEFDYGTVARHHPYATPGRDHDGSQPVGREDNGQTSGQTGSSPTISPRARDLFSDGSCAWTEYYTDQTTLEKVGRLYSQDFDLFGWYDLDAWREKLDACFK